MSMIAFALMVAVPSLDSEFEPLDHSIFENDFRAAANVLQLQIVTLFEADNPEEVESAATQLLATTNLLVNPLETAGETDALAGLHALRGWALWSLDQIEEADAAFALAGPVFAREFGYLSYRHDLAWDQRDAEKLLEIFESELVATSDRTTLIIHDYALQDLRVVRYWFDYEDAADSRLAEILIESGWGADSAPGDLDWIYVRAMEGRHRAGDEAGASEALTAIRAPSYLLEILIDQDFADYHNAVETEHGTDLGRAATSIYTDLNAIWNDRLGDARYLLNYIIVLRNTGRYQEIIDRYSPLVDELMAAIASGNSDHYLLNRNGFFVVNYLATSELRLGHGDRAINRMDALLELEIEDHPNLINQAINRLEMLFQTGDYAESLQSARALEELGDEVVAPFGRMLIRSFAACAAHQLDNGEERDAWMDRLLGMDDVPEIILVDAHLCFNDIDAAEQLALSALSAEDPASMVEYFQILQRWRPMGEHDRQWRQRRDLLSERPAIREAIENNGGIRQLDLAELGG